MCVPELDNGMLIWYIHTYNTYPHTHTGRYHVRVLVLDVICFHPGWKYAYIPTYIRMYIHTCM